MCIKSICRICLASEVQMHVIENTEFHMIYEKMCEMKLHTEDGRPTQVCYLCYTQLGKCRELQIKAKKSEDLLTHILNTGIELTESSIKSIDRQLHKLTESRSISCVEFTNVSQHDVQQEAAIKEEVHTKEEVVVKEEIVIKQEAMDDFEVGNMDLTSEDKYIVPETSDPYLEECQMVNNDSQSDNKSDSEDGIVRVKVEVEVEGKTESEQRNSNTKGLITNIHHIMSSKDQQQEELLERAKSLNYLNSPFKCEKCCKGFVDVKVYENHRKKHKDNGKPFACSLCEYKCTCNGHLVAHMRTHTGEKPHSCSLCDYKCVYSGRLKAHMRTHTGEKPYACTICEYKCTLGGQLKAHMSTHTGEKRYSCTQCDYKCARNENLIRHFRKHTGEKPYSCTLCEYSCSEKANLKAHMRKHTGEKPYSCTLCDYKCTISGQLKAHMRKHTGEKPYSCTHCEFKCSRNESLIRHFRQHTGEKPYSCTLCEYKCSHSGSLKKHLKRKHDTET